MLRLILSRSARSARLTTHYDLDFPKKPQTGPYRCYKHGRTCRPTEDAAKFLRRYSTDTFNRIREFASIRQEADVSVITGDSRSIEFPAHELVVTSPPYVGLIDYHEQQPLRPTNCWGCRGATNPRSGAHRGRSERCCLQHDRADCDRASHTKKSDGKLHVSQAIITRCQTF